VQRIINDPERVVDDMLLGYVKAHGHLVAATDNPRVLKLKDAPIAGKGVYFYTENDPDEEQFGTAALIALKHRPKIKAMWFRGGWWDALTMAWKDVQDGACYDRPPVSEGGPAPGGTRQITVSHVPEAESLRRSTGASSSCVISRSRSPSLS